MLISNRTTPNTVDPMAMDRPRMPIRVPPSTGTPTSSAQPMAVTSKAPNRPPIATKASVTGSTSTGGNTSRRVRARVRRAALGGSVRVWASRMTAPITPRSSATASPAPGWTEAASSVTTGGATTKADSSATDSRANAVCTRFWSTSALQRARTADPRSGADAPVRAANRNQSGPRSVDGHNDDEHRRCEDQGDEGDREHPGLAEAIHRRRPRRS